MNIETLKERLAYLENSIAVQQMMIKQQQDQVSQSFANLNSLIGSKCETEHWIKEFEKPVEEPKVEEPKPGEAVKCAE